MKNNPIQIAKKGEDGFKTFSIRLKDEIVSSLDYIAGQSNRSRNELINIFLAFCIANYEIIEYKDLDTSKSSAI